MFDVALCCFRVFLGINPDGGTKASASRKKSATVPPRVLQLVRRVADFEWLGGN